MEKMADKLQKVPPSQREILKTNVILNFKGKLKTKFGMSARVHIALELL